MSNDRNIAIDWDGTFTAIPNAVQAFITVAETEGYTCYIVTQRDYTHPVELPPELQHVQVIYTANHAKIDFCREEHNLEFRIYLDDKPLSQYMSHDTIANASKSNGRKQSTTSPGS